MKLLPVLLLALVALLNDSLDSCSCQLAIFGMIGSIFSSSMGARSQRKANEANLEINKMNNEFNAKEAERARAFQLDMWNKENAYNTPAYRDWETDRKSTRLNSSHITRSRMPSSA